MIKRSTDYDLDLVNECSKLMAQAAGERKSNWWDALSDTERAQKAIELLNEACYVLEGTKHDNVCSQLTSLISENFASNQDLVFNPKRPSSEEHNQEVVFNPKEVGSSEAVEEDVQEDIEDEEASFGDWEPDNSDDWAKSK